MTLFSSRYSESQSIQNTMQKKYLISFVFLQCALHQKKKKKKLFSAVEMDKERSCFVLKMLQKSWLLSWSCPAPCLFVWQHQVTMVTGRLQGAGETQIILVPRRDQPFPSAIPPHCRGRAQVLFGAFILLFADPFWLVLVSHFLFARHDMKIHAVCLKEKKKKRFCFGMCTMACESYQKTLWLLILNVK